MRQIIFRCCTEWSRPFFTTYSKRQYQMKRNETHVWNTHEFPLIFSIVRLRATRCCYTFGAWSNWLVFFVVSVSALQRKLLKNLRNEKIFRCLFSCHWNKSENRTKRFPSANHCESVCVCVWWVPLTTLHSNNSNITDYIKATPFQRQWAWNWRISISISMNWLQMLARCFSYMISALKWSV